jgi:hypothetical protein
MPLVIAVGSGEAAASPLLATLLFPINSIAGE